MKALAEQIRPLALKPCIWLSSKIYLDSALVQEKLEWLLRVATGSTALIEESSFLDLCVLDLLAFSAVFDVQWRKCIIFFSSGCLHIGREEKELN